jgi:CHAD domain-containing protein
MRKAAMPIDLLRAQAAALTSMLPRLHDGEVNAIHDARVASRRIREVLPLTTDWHPQATIDDLETTFRRIGKRLGRVRDADERGVLLAHFESRVPPAAASFVAFRREQERDRLRLVRKTIKQFERLDLARVLGTIVAGRSIATRPWFRSSAEWPNQLRCAIRERAGEAREALHHATGVYFPNRLHRTRIALKKLRYALEIACATGADTGANESLRYLKNTQDVLGDLHDRQVLIDDLASRSTREVEIDRDHITLVTHVIEAECRDLHTQFLGRRTKLLAICDRLEYTYGHRTLFVGPAAAAIVVSSAFYLWRRAHASAPAVSDHSVTMRIPIRATAALGR